MIRGEKDGERSELRSLFQSGKDLSPKDVARLELSIAADSDKPASHDLRCRLLGYYSIRDLSSRRVLAPRVQHIFWIISHAPWSIALESPYAQINESLNPRHYRTGLQLFREQIRLNPTDVRIVGCAAAYATGGRDLGEAETLLLRAEEIEPDSSKWPLRLGYHYQLRLHGCDKNDVAVVRGLAEKALAAYARSLDRLAGDGRPWSYPTAMCVLAARAGRYDEARASAESILRSLCENPDKPFYLACSHEAHAALGLVALAEGTIADAKAHLLLAGEAAGTIDGRAFSYDFTLAERLYDLGEKDVVAEYVRLGALTDKERSEFKRYWRRVEEGETRDFGATFD